MKSRGGLFFKGDVENSYENLGLKVSINITGHSLGGASGQLLSLMMSQYFRTLPDVANAKLHVQNFSFNTPKSAGNKLAKAYAEEMNLGYLSSFNFSVAGDPITEWEPKKYAGTCTDPNNTSDIIGGGVSVNVGYCVHKEFPSKMTGDKKNMKNHDLGLMIESLNDESMWHTHIGCMKKGFVSPIRGDTSPL